MNINEQMNEMTKALEEAMVVQQKYADALVKLKQENQFLADTITNNNLGKISTERRELLARVTQAELESKAAISEAELAISKANSAIDEANNIKSEYEQKLDEIAVSLKEINSPRS